MPVDNAYYDFRDELADETVRDLIGPPPGADVRDDEAVLNEPPVQRYIAGMLFPRSQDAVDGNNDVDDVDDDDGVADPPVSLANVRYPSAMGVSFAVLQGDVSKLDVSITAARYEEHTIEATDEEPARNEWRRVPIVVNEPRLIDVTTPTVDARKKVDTGLEAYWRVRRPDAQGRIAITTGLINQQIQPEGTHFRDEVTFFQVEIRISANGEEVFVDRSFTTATAADEDARSYRLLYRHMGNFATGHGCSADWTATESYPPKATEIRSTFAPTHDMLLSDSNGDIQSDHLGMRLLARDDRESTLAGLRNLLGGYRSWIDEQQAAVATLEESLVETAVSHIEGCVDAADRIETGIQAVEHDDLVLEAFQMANEAMLRQRAQTVWLVDKEGEPDTETDVHRWRPFQLAFILLNIAGIADPEQEDRSTVDLLWFPTGGGKTEAYLGLIAFTIFLRRLRSDGKDAGLTVIMRYTLRLLTLQQYQRALLLICACEAIRRNDKERLGSQEISISLWVGGAATPNTYADAKSALKRHQSNQEVDEGDPVQIRECPWCGIPLSHDNYWVRNNERLVIMCKNAECEFEKGLPAFLVDEDVYRWRPTLMIATVDKFASIPWRNNMADVFSRDGDNSPPELIIQDELHLISGPLGTLVGLYETAIDALCERTDGIGPKIIASTATIRRASSQIERLYAEDAFQFPPPGLDARDSYFAVEVPREDKGSRRYQGLMAPATSHASLMVRSYAGLLQNARSIEGSDEVRDPYWTLVGYFNSLRVLGGALLQVRDDVPDRTSILAGRADSANRFEGSEPELIELTSREKSSDIPEHLARMDRTYGDPQCIDTILATNMISVGMDIDRLGLMAVMGQPQSSSEYIQSTSRVGRRHPGLVFVLFNAFRSRDRSHFEGFKSFHSSLYRQVDASSVTPFSSRARDRGLHAVLVGLLRAKETRYRANNTASDVDELRSVAAPYIDQIVARAERVAPDEAAATRKALDDFISHWIHRAEEEQNLVFSNRRQPTTALLFDAGSETESPESTDTLWSLRDVDSSSNLYLLRG